MNKLIFTVICIFMCSVLLASASYALECADITNDITITCTGIDAKRITDNNIATHSAGENVKIEFKSEGPIEGLYIKYNKAPSKGSLDGKTDVATYGFLHEYIPLNSATSAVLTYQDTDICDIQVFSKGTLPSYVQMWQNGNDNTDLLLCATHSDDDQLFFAGLLPYYAKVKNANVSVAYFINHYDTYNRTHELLDGLWHCGVKNYPEISHFPDGYSESSKEAEQFLKNKGFEYNDLITFQKYLLEKYKPLVVVLHDFNGEYGHGAHMLNTKTFVEAYENADEGDYIPEKVYVHLYGENKIILPIDEPSEHLFGKTPFNVSQEAFGFHKSQHWTWFYSWIYGKKNNITKSSQIAKYSPAEYGMYFSRVGDDAEKKDMFENVLTYSQREEIRKIEAEEIARLEKEQAEKEAVLKEMQLKQEALKKQQIIQERNRKTTIAVSSIIIACIIVLTVIYIKHKKKR